jgi:hypothetical protein
MPQYDYGYYFGATEMWSASAEYQSPVQQDDLKKESHPVNRRSNPRWFILGAIASCLMISLGTLTWNTIRITEAPESYNPITMPTQFGGSEALQ